MEFGTYAEYPAPLAEYVETKLVPLYNVYCELSPANKLKIQGLMTGVSTSRELNRRVTRNYRIFLKNILKIEDRRVASRVDDILQVIHMEIPAVEFMAKIRQFDQLVTEHNAILCPKKQVGAHDSEAFIPVDLETLASLSRKIRDLAPHIEKSKLAYVRCQYSSAQPSQQLKQVICPECRSFVEREYGERPMTEGEIAENTRRIQELEDDIKTGKVKVKEYQGCSQNFCGMGWTCSSCAYYENYTCPTDTLRDLRRKTGVWIEWNECKCGRSKVYRRRGDPMLKYYPDLVSLCGGLQSNPFDLIGPCANNNHKKNSYHFSLKFGEI